MTGEFHLNLVFTILFGEFRAQALICLSIVGFDDRVRIYISRSPGGEDLGGGGA